MEDFLQKLKGKNIHLVGATGAEGSNLLRFLVKHRFSHISAHDFIKREDFQKSFNLWHKGIKNSEKENLYRQFTDDLSKTSLYSGQGYLKNITQADLIFVPQSWRLYPKRNSLLFEAKKKNIPFYSLTRIYLDYSPAQVIGITGTVGKGSTAYILVQLLESFGKKVYFAGNETWKLQVADKLDEMKPSDILVLEISHRQLLDGFSRAPGIAVFTNLYPNHLDELSWEDYKELKFSLLEKQTSMDISVLNYESPELRALASKLKSKVIFFSDKNKEMNTKNIQKIYDLIMNIKLPHYPANILSASAVAEHLGATVEKIKRTIFSLSSLPARLELVRVVEGIKFYDDIKSTTPWATLAALSKLGKSTILICGGKTKGINYQEFTDNLRQQVKYLVLLRSDLSDNLTKHFPQGSFFVADDLKEAIKMAREKAEKGDNILISPAAAFFYSSFIKGKYSLRGIITSLPLKAKA